MPKLPSKETLFQFCESFVHNRMERVQNNIQDIQDSFASETKRSAGDKHETGRAMLQLEREKLGRQLSEAGKMREILKRTKIKPAHSVVALGSLVQTSKGNYFLAVSAGAYKEKDQLVYCVSAATPIGQILLGKSEADKVVFNGEALEILKIH